MFQIHKSHMDNAMDNAFLNITLYSIHENQWFMLQKNKFTFCTNISKPNNISALKL